MSAGLRPLMLASGLGLAALAAQPVAADAALEQKVLKAYGFDSDAGLAAMLTDISSVMANLNCGAAMTQKACVATNKHFRAELTGDLPKVRKDLLRFFEARGGLRKALRAARADGKPKRDCSGAVNEACKTLVDFFFGGGVLDQLSAARKKAAREVKPFYKDGRPFKG